MVNFLIVNSLLVYNVILSRHALNCLQVTIFMYHLMVKFPTISGVEEVKGSQHEAKICYSLAIKRNESLDSFDTVETLRELLELK